MTSAEFSARLAGRAFDIGRAAWNACAGTEHPFTRYEFFDAVEASGSATARTGWRPLHLVVERGGTVEGILPLYLKNHSQANTSSITPGPTRSSARAATITPSSRRACRSRR